MSLRIAGLTIRLDGMRAPLLSAARERLGRFLHRGRTRFRVRIEEGGDPRGGRARWRWSSRRGRLEMRRGACFVRVDLRRGTGRARMPFRYAHLDTLLRALATAALLRQGALLLHAAGAVIAGRGHLFPGASGSGKSTLARLLGPERVLSDELVALQGGRDGPAISGTPFSGELRHPGRARTAALAAVHFLDCHPAGHRVPLPAPEAVARLMRAAVLPEARGAELGRVLRLLCRVAGEVPAEELGFDPDGPRSPLLKWLQRSARRGR